MKNRFELGKRLCQTLAILGCFFILACGSGSNSPDSQHQEKPQDSDQNKEPVQKYSLAQTIEAIHKEINENGTQIDIVLAMGARAYAPIPGHRFVYWHTGTNPEFDGELEILSPFSKEVFEALPQNQISNFIVDWDTWPILCSKDFSKTDVFTAVFAALRPQGRFYTDMENGYLGVLVRIAEHPNAVHLFGKYYATTDGPGTLLDYVLSTGKGYAGTDHLKVKHTRFEHNKAVFKNIGFSKMKFVNPGDEHYFIPAPEFKKNSFIVLEK